MRYCNCLLLGTFMGLTVTSLLACMYLYLVQQFPKPNYPLYSLHLPRPFFSLIVVENMKLIFHSGALLFFLFFLISSSKLSARLLTTEQGQNGKVDEVSGEDFVLELEGVESVKLLGMEEDCNSGDEECLNRRMTLEAHLDYIYTQHHKP